jgi:hypothetical protein
MLLLLPLREFCDVVGITAAVASVEYFAYFFLLRQEEFLPSDESWRYNFTAAQSSVKQMD